MARAVPLNPSALPHSGQRQVRAKCPAGCDLSMVELVMAYEREFKINIPDADADRFQQVQDVVGYLRKHNVLK